MISIFFCICTSRALSCTFSPASRWPSLPPSLRPIPAASTPSAYSNHAVCVQSLLFHLYAVLRFGFCFFFCAAIRARWAIPPHLPFVGCKAVSNTPAPSYCCCLIFVYACLLQHAACLACAALSLLFVAGRNCLPACCRFRRPPSPLHDPTSVCAYIHPIF